MVQSTQLYSKGPPGDPDRDLRISQRILSCAERMPKYAEGASREIVECLMLTRHEAL
jgi:hypothetical protein